MLRSTTLALLLTTVAAFISPPQPARKSSALRVLKDMPGVTEPLGAFDPWGLSGIGDEETVLWYRAAELKHSRVAMLATAGWISNAMGVSFPGELSQEDGLTFSSLSHNPLEAWGAVPETLKYQMLGAIGLVEILAETAKPHYMKGGPMGLQFDPLRLGATKDAVALRRRQNRELNNGRLAMIGILSFFAALEFPGSVPALSNLHYL